MFSTGDKSSVCTDGDAGAARRVGRPDRRIRIYLGICLIFLGYRGHRGHAAVASADAGTGAGVAVEPLTTCGGGAARGVRV